MDKEFVPYEQALALKEIDFDEPCLGHYYERDSKQCLVIYGEFAPDTSKWLKAPTFSQAFRWFRDKFDLDKTIDSWKEQPVDSEMWPKAYQYYIDGTAYYPYYKTHEEAELACLIKLIEIIKEKKS